MAYLVIINASDGTHVHYFKGLDKAREEYFAQIGRAPRQEDSDAMEVCGMLIEADDWGRRILLKQAPEGIKSARGYAALRQAYDRRECGVATASDRRRLQAAGW